MVRSRPSMGLLYAWVAGLFGVFGVGVATWAASPSDPPKPPKATPAPAAASIEGYYACQGKDDADGYEGVTVIRKHGQAYVVQWVVSGGPSYTGCGTRQGDRFTVGWAMVQEGKTLRGVHVFRIDGTTLVGQWASLPGSGQLYAETLTFIKGL